MLLGYQHQWAPGHRTLVLGSYLNDDLDVDNPTRDTLILRYDPGSGASNDAIGGVYAQDYQSELDIGGLEIQQIFQDDPHTWVVGAKGQAGQFDVANTDNPLSGGGIGGFLFEKAGRLHPFFVFFIMTVAAAEVAVGLALIVAIFRTKKTIDVDQINMLKG